MSEIMVNKAVGDWILHGAIMPFTTRPNLSYLGIGYRGESPRLDLNGMDALEQLRDLRYAIDRVIAQAEDEARNFLPKSP